LNYGLLIYDSELQKQIDQLSPGEYKVKLSIYSENADPKCEEVFSQELYLHRLEE